MSTWMSKYWFFIPLFPLGIYLLLKLIRMTRAGKLRPGPHHPVDTRGRVAGGEDHRGPAPCGTLGTLIASGVPILEALAIVRETANNAVFERMFQRVLESIREGDTIADPMRNSKLVDDMVTNMIEVGEETGDLDSMLYKVADFYDEEVDNTVKSLISLLEPIMIVFLGGAIGGIVISLFLPMIKLLEGLSK